MSSIDSSIYGSSILSTIEHDRLFLLVAHTF